MLKSEILEEMVIFLITWVEKSKEGSLLSKQSKRCKYLERDEVILH